MSSVLLFLLEFPLSFGNPSCHFFRLRAWLVPFTGERGAIQELSWPWRWLLVFSLGHWPEAGASGGGSVLMQVPSDDRKPCGSPMHFSKGCREEWPWSAVLAMMVTTGSKTWAACPPLLVHIELSTPRLHDTLTRKGQVMVRIAISVLPVSEWLYSLDFNEISCKMYHWLIFYWLINFWLIMDFCFLKYRNTTALNWHSA